MSFSSQFGATAKLLYKASEVMAPPLFCAGAVGYGYAGWAMKAIHKYEVAELEAKRTEQEVKHKIKVAELEAKYAAAMDELQKNRS